MFSCSLLRVDHCVWRDGQQVMLRPLPLSYSHSTVATATTVCIGVSMTILFFLFIPQNFIVFVYVYFLIPRNECLSLILAHFLYFIILLSWSNSPCGYPKYLGWPCPMSIQPRIYSLNHAPISEREFCCGYLWLYGYLTRTSVILWIS